MTEPAATWPAPAPGPAPRSRMIVAQAGLELRTLLRNGEQLLLTAIVPVLLLISFSAGDIISLGPGRRIDFLTPGVLALAVMSTSFTSLAIATGFERRYGVLKRLGATPLSRSGLIAAKAVTVAAVEVGQVALLAVIGLAMGWQPKPGPLGLAGAALILITGSAAFSGLAMLLAGTLRAEATLAGANLIYLMLLGSGGIIVPITKFPAAMRPLLLALPSGAMSDGLRAVFQYGAGIPGRDLLVLAAWAVAGVGLAVRLFRWE